MQRPLPELAEAVVADLAGVLVPSAIQVGGRSLVVADPDKGRHGVREEPKAFLARVQRRLRVLPLRDVPNDLGRADDLARLVVDRGNRDGHRQATAVPVHANGVVLMDALAAAHAHEPPARGFLEARRLEEADGPPDHFRGRIAEELLGRGIPGGDLSVERLADDRVRRRGDDRREAIRLELRTPRRADIPENEHGSPERSRRVPDRRAAVGDGNIGAAAPDEHGVIGEPADEALAQTRVIGLSTGCRVCSLTT